MLIKYLGPKKEKKVTVGTKELLFNPCCELNPVFDIDIINWLLHRDRAGLFVVADVEDKTPSVEHPEATNVLKESDIPQIKQEAEPTETITPKERKPKDKQKRGKK